MYQNLNIRNAHSARVTKSSAPLLPPVQQQSATVQFSSSAAAPAVGAGATPTPRPPPPSAFVPNGYRPVGSVAGGGAFLPSIEEHRQLSAGMLGEKKESTLSKKSGGGSSGSPPRAPSPPKPRTSKLELEVQRLEAAGTLLVQRPGEEVAGIILLEKAIFSRSRFAVLATEIWRRAEQLVVLCCQVVFRLTQQCDESSLQRCKEVLRVAERVLNPPPTPPNSMAPVAEPFDGFDVLKRALLASVRVAYAFVLSRLPDESSETILSVVETALASEQPRPSAATLYNLAVAYVNAGRFDEAAAAVVRCIDLVSHYTTMHLNLTRETEPPYRCFIAESATYSVLCHHLVASIGQWCNLPQLTLQHAVLALRCAERCLGTQHALTTRCAQYVRSLEMTRMSLGSPTLQHPLGGISQDMLSKSMKNRRESFGAPPKIPFQMQSFASEFLPSLLVPFTLVQPHPISFELAPAPASRPPPPLLYSREPTALLDATTTRKMTNEALRSAKAKQLTSIPKPPTTGRARLGKKPQSKKQKEAELQQQQQQQLEAEQQLQPVDSSSPRYMSVIPLRDFDLYQQIQGEVADLVSNTERFVAGEINKRRKNQVTLLRLPPVQSDAVTGQYSHSTRKLREMSYLRPDHTLDDEALWNHAAGVLQKFMRRFVAQLHVERRQAAVAGLIRRHTAADRIHETWGLFKLRVAAKRRLRFLRAKRSELECLVMVQSFLRFHQSIEAFAGHFETMLKLKLWMVRNAKKMDLAATIGQAVWRSHASRGRTRELLRRATQIQRFFRKFLLYLAMRLVVFRRRERRRAFFWRLNSAAFKLQHWFAREIVRVVALRALRRRQALRDAELATRLDVEWQRYLPFRNADEVACGKRIERFLRSCIWRRREGERLRRVLLRHAAANIVRRMFLRKRARMVKAQHAAAQLEKRRVQRRREEVREAVHDLQRYGRGLLGRMAVFTDRHRAAQQETAAHRIQRFALVVFARVERARLAKRAGFEQERYAAAALRHVSALQLQCAWRRFVARKFVRGYGTFLAEGRNAIVTRIQRAYRRHRAHVRFAALARRRRDAFAAEARRQIEACAATRIQKSFRSALQLRMGKKFAVATVLELSRLRTAASRIQRQWRAARARITRFDLQRARDSQIAQWRADEHLAAVAVHLQRAARGRFQFRGAVAAARPDLERRAARRIQCMARCVAARKRMQHLQLCRDELLENERAVKERNGAATLIQRNVRMRQARSRYQLRLVAAKLIRASWHAVFVRRQLRTDRIMRDYEEYLRTEREGDGDEEEQTRTIEM